MTVAEIPHMECIEAALRNGTVDPREKTLALQDRIAELEAGEQPTPLHLFLTEWFVTHLGVPWKGYAHALACDVIEAGFTNEGERR